MVSSFKMHSVTCKVNLSCGAFIQDKLDALMRASQVFQENPSEMEALWDSCSCLMYSLEDRQKQLGLGDKVGANTIQLRV